MKRYLKPAFSWIGVASTIISFGNCFNDNLQQGSMLQAIAFGVAALACFRAADFFAANEK